MIILGDGKPLLPPDYFPEFPETDLESIMEEEVVGEVFRIKICKDEKDYVGWVVWLRGENVFQRDASLEKLRNQLRTLAQQGTTNKDYQIRRQQLPDESWKYPNANDEWF